MKFKFNDRVVVARTSSDELDGKQGNVVGISASAPGMVVYIVILDEPYDYGYGKDWTGIALTEHCLDAI